MFSFLVPLFFIISPLWILIPFLLVSIGLFRFFGVFYCLQYSTFREFGLGAEMWWRVAVKKGDEGRRGRMEAKI